MILIVKPTIAGYGTIVDCHTPTTISVCVPENYPYTTNVGDELPYDTYKRSDNSDYHIAVIVSTLGT